MSQDLEKTHQINYDILVEGGSPFGSNIAHIHHSLWVVCVDVEYGSVDHAGHVTWVGRGAGHARVGGEANLNR